MGKNKNEKTNFVLYGICFTLCFFAFMIAEASVNERSAEVLGEAYVTIVYSVGLICTGLGYLSFPALRHFCKTDGAKTALISIVGACCAAALILFYASYGAVLFLIGSALMLFLFGHIGGCVYYNTALFFRESSCMGRMVGISMGAAILLQFLVQNLSLHPIVLLAINLFSLAYVIVFSVNAPNRTSDATVLRRSDIKSKRIALMLIFSVALMSIVSGMADSVLTSFHAEQTYDVYSGVRLFYALGLLAAGWIADIRKLQYLPLATVCAILTSSVCNIFLSEQASYFVGAALMYVYSGFYVIFLTVMFLEYAPRTAHPELWAGMGRVVRSLSVALVIVPANMLQNAFGSTALAVASCVLSIGVLLILLPFISNASVFQRPTVSDMEAPSFSAEESLKLYAEHYGMTPRETEVLEKLLTTEESVQEIADSLYVSRRMLQRYIASIYEKTQIKTRIGLFQSYTQFIAKLK